MCLQIKSMNTLRSLKDSEESEKKKVKNGNYQGEKNCCSSDYKLLPSKFFTYNCVPRPLVSKSWLNLLKVRLKYWDNEVTIKNESEEEDSIPLARLIKGLSQKKLSSTELLETHNTSNQLHSSEKKHNALCNKSLCSVNLVVERKPGRPKKPEKNSVYQEKFNQALAENNGQGPIGFWEDSSNSYFQNQDEISKRDKKNSVESVVQGNYSHMIIQSSVTVVKDNLSCTSRKLSEINNFEHKKNKSQKSSFYCKECGKCFSAISTLNSHQRIHNGTLLKCPECNKGFTTKYLLKCHMRIHSGDLFICNKCNKGFTTAELLKVHSRGHTGDRPFACDICTRTFSSASNLSQHKETHSSEKTFLCFQCGASFRQKRCLDCHMLTHSEKNHVCKVCGKLWARKSDLIEHMRVHTGAKPYCCSICPQKFTQASSLKRHQIVHLDVRPIKCETCGKTFKCEEYQKRHVRKHEKRISL